MNVFFVGAMQNQAGHEMIIFQTSTESVYKCLSGIITTLDSDFRPMATRALLLSADAAVSDDIGPYEPDKFGDYEQHYLRMMTEGVDRDFCSDRIVPL